MSVQWSYLYWLLFGGLVGLVLETVYTLKVRKGAEYKWYVFYYILVSVQWSHLYWLLFGGLAGLVLETVYTLKVRKGAEYKWYVLVVILGISVQVIFCASVTDRGKDLHCYSFFVIFHIYGHHPKIRKICKISKIHVIHEIHKICEMHKIHET